MAASCAHHPWLAFWSSWMFTAARGAAEPCRWSLCRSAVARSAAPVGRRRGHVGEGRATRFKSARQPRHTGQTR
eukprot:12626935-Alexandrium_andersonii.AAC.1